VSDEGDAADDAADGGGDTQDDRDSGGRTALVTKAATRPQRPSGKRSRQRALSADDEESATDASSAKAEVAKKGSAKKDASKSAKDKAAAKSKKAGKAGKPGTRSVNPIAFVYNYLKQVVTEMRKVIWPSRKQMLTYTSVVLVFLAFMVALVGGTDLGLSKLVLLVFG